MLALKWALSPSQTTGPIRTAPIGAHCVHMPLKRRRSAVRGRWTVMV